MRKKNIIKKYNKIIFNIFSINNFTNFKSYNFFVLSLDFGSIKEKIITVYLLHSKKSPIKTTGIPIKPHLTLFSG